MQKKEQPRPSSGSSSPLAYSASPSMRQPRRLCSLSLRAFWCAILVPFALFTLVGEREFMVATALNKPGQREEEWRALDRAYRLFPFQYRIREARTMSLATLGGADPQEAIADLDILLATDPHGPQLRRLRRRHVKRLQLRMLTGPEAWYI